MRITCSRSGKNTFGTLAQAQSVAAGAHVKRGLTLRVYRCEFCGFWHLTTRAWGRRR